jgi:hypothetical protein|tara:strand:- start:9412 stop:9873 length:462 start_codon:yes stop_codon:yes gene_type:complete
MLPVPNLEFFCDLQVALDPIREMGSGRAGFRRIIPIVGGTATGPHFNGKVLNLGADWQTIFENGLAELDTRYAIETDDGATIEVMNYGFRHGPPAVMAAVARGENVSPDQYYMRTHAKLETGAKNYAWVNKMLFVGVGARHQSTVIMKLYVIR